MIKPIALTALGLAAACSDLPASEDRSVAANLEAYRTNYVAACLPEMVSSGWTKEQAETMCECMVDILAKNKTMAQLRTLTISDLKSVADQCRTKIENQDG